MAETPHTETGPTDDHRIAIDPDASPGTGDFADEHDETGTDHEIGDRDGEPESPRGRSGLEPTNRPN